MATLEVSTLENSEIMAVGSPTIELARKFAEEFTIPKAYGSYAELVSDPEIDVIYIGTPHSLHLENTLLALNHNKNVLCEKPVGVNLNTDISTSACVAERVMNHI